LVHVDLYTGNSHSGESCEFGDDCTNGSQVHVGVVVVVVVVALALWAGVRVLGV
jgi:hypothetical protein